MFVDISAKCLAYILKYTKPLLIFVNPLSEYLHSAEVCFAFDFMSTQTHMPSLLDQSLAEQRESNNLSCAPLMIVSQRVLNRSSS